MNKKELKLLGLQNQMAAWIAKVVRLEVANQTSARPDVVSTAWLERISDLEVLLSKYRKAIDDIYNHNAASRAAVKEHFGLSHPPEAMRSNG